MKTQYIASYSSQGAHKLAYTSWGEVDNPRVLVCAHGLTRNRHDFDFIAHFLSRSYRVICFDLPGRGESDWLANKLDYGYPQYITDAMMVISHSAVEKVDWLGTSMGGILGLLLASMDHSPINRLILNDIGPFIPHQALQRIAKYVGKLPLCDSAEELEKVIRKTYAAFGNLSDQSWQEMLTYGKRHLANGKVTLNYDPGIAEPFVNTPIKDIELWPAWQKLSQACLLIRGANSDMLSEQTAQKMLASQPSTQLITIQDTGHSPALMDADQCQKIADWLACH